MPFSLPPHPLDADAYRVSGASWWPVLGPGQCTTTATGPQWHTCRDLLAELQEWVARIHAWLVRSHGDGVPASVAPTYLMGWYLDALARTCGYWLELCNRVPHCDPDRLGLRLDGGRWPAGAVVSAGPFHCLPQDRAANHPDALVVDDRAQLVESLHDVVWSHAQEFFAAFQPAVRIGSRQRFGMLADQVETALIDGATATGDRLTGLDDAFVVAGPSNRGLRRSCCFAYKLSSELLCTRCPRRAR